MSNISKKLFVALALIVCGTALAWHGTITGDKWISLAEWVGGFYLVAQGGVDMVTKLKGR